MESPMLDEKRVLFQKLGSYWYAFVDVDGNEEDVFFTRLPEGLDPVADRYEIYEVLEEEMDLKKAA